MGSWALTKAGHKWAGGGEQSEPGQVGADWQQWHLSAGNPEAELRCCQENKACLLPLISACLGHFSSGDPLALQPDPSPTVLPCLYLWSFPNPCPAPVALPHPPPLTC